MGRYRVLEDVALADCALEVEGRDLRDLFETAAGALAELMVDPATVETSVQRRITLSAESVERPGSPSRPRCWSWTASG